MVTTLLKHGTRVIVFFALVLFYFYSCSAMALAKHNRIQRLHPFLDNGAYALKIKNTVIRQFRADEKFIPASTQKIFTALMALEILGPEYRFATSFFLDNDNNLYIQGHGDPFLISENIRNIAKTLHANGLHNVRSIILDDSAFALEGPPPDSANTKNPYDATSGALAVNFNALPLQKLKSGKILSGEPQTPLLPIMVKFGEYFPIGKHRVNVNAMIHTKPHSNTLRYTGELFTAIFQQQGITVQNGYSIDRTPENSRLVYTYESPSSVSDLIRSILHFSNNFIANQLFLSCGSRLFGYPATWQKAQRGAKDFLSIRLGLNGTSIKVVDGSGLSIVNRITAQTMLQLLERFKPYADLLKNQDGTLLKSGTLTGVYCYAGYFNNDVTLAPFVLFLNQHRNTRKSMLHILRKEYLTVVKEK